MRRESISYAVFGALGVATIGLNAVTWRFSQQHQDRITDVLYFELAVFVLSFVEVQLDRGRLTLSGIAIGASTVLLNPLDVTLVAVAVGFANRGRGPWRIVGNAAMLSFGACLAAAFGSVARSGHELTFWPRVAVLLMFSIASLAIVAAVLSIRSGESVMAAFTHSLSLSPYLAYGYFALASLVISYVVSGSALGYLLATIIFVLALALTDTIAGRRIRRVLESELSDADRHLFHSRAVEGVVHNLRNHIASAVGYLKEIDLNRLDPVDREAVETATAAANDAATVLRSLSQGATPRVSYAPTPVDLNELVVRALGMARPRARTKEIELGLRESADDVKVKGDPLLLREVITNLVNNAIDAAPNHGRVELMTGRRGNGWPYFSVSDNGPGVSDDNRHHLFEPHFTTKEGGTGLGLFMSYGIIREHQGRLNYEGSRRGAVFTVELPPHPG